jgi:hypothetical protein
MRMGGEEGRQICMTAGRESKSHGTTRIEGRQRNRQHTREWTLSKDDEESKFGHVDFYSRREEMHIGTNK